MDKNAKEHVRRRKKPRPASSSDSSSSSSDSDSGSSSNSYSSSSSAGKKHRKTRKVRRRSSTSDDAKARRREKHACHRKSEAKKNHLKRKMKEAKAKKRALSPRSLSERKRHHLMIKERLKEKEREKLRLARERESATGVHHHAVEKHKLEHKYRTELKRKATSPAAVEMRHFHHQIPGREKLLVQARRERSPSERKLSTSKDIRHRLDERRGERERAEAIRKQERDDELVRCQRERERLNHEKMLRREKIKEYDEGDRLLPRPAERELALATARANRERSPDQEKSARHLRREKLYEHGVYEREYSGLDAEHERDYVLSRRREISPVLSEGEYPPEPRGREFYPGDERFEGERRYLPQSGRPLHYPPNWDEERSEKMYHSEKSRDSWKLNKNAEWQEHDPHWQDKHGSAKWPASPLNHLIKKKSVPQDEENWDVDEAGYRPPVKKITPKDWNEQGRPKTPADSPSRGSLGSPLIEGVSPAISHPRWPHHEWRGRIVRPSTPGHPLLGPQPRGFRPNIIERPEFRRALPHLPHVRPHHPPGFRHPRLPFPHQSKMVYTNPNLLQNKAAQLAKMAAEKAAALSAAASLSNSPGFVGSGGITVTYSNTPSSTITTANNINFMSRSISNEKNEYIEGKKVGIGLPIPSTTVSGSENKDNLSEVSDELEETIDKLKRASMDSGTTTTKTRLNTRDDDDLSDFEEISDGELEEESRKNLGDALGVDWASLVEDSKTRREAVEPTTTGKQKWQPHRIILDVGISLKYAGEDFAKQIIADAEEKLKMEEFDLKPQNFKIKIEKFDEDTNAIKELQIGKIEASECVESLPELACVQVAQRKQKEDRNNLIFKACGRNSRALTARKDLKLRRQLCGLSEVERSSRVVSDNMKELAIKNFQKAVGTVN